MAGKNVQMNVWIVKSQEEMATIHSYQDTWLPSLNIINPQEGGAYNLTSVRPSVRPSVESHISPFIWYYSLCPRVTLKR